ncbi:Bgt-1044 [Blumeria graminis f. sp. tritici]|uniref:Bgt-1044 n=2 Tax=Blumeria graminis f. sp. tritici TaxID=62690 RepID=A0A061HKG8_BLUGR|nr:hypothetical protein BGT96224_1044 [Blumeria graminis f. sp. tritici 96224]VCU39761.1 Bgt-1044 [Blumeria graminis f. sp. tritici]
MKILSKWNIRYRLRPHVMLRKPCTPSQTHLLGLRLSCVSESTSSRGSVEASLRLTTITSSIVNNKAELNSDGISCQLNQYSHVPQCTNDAPFDVKNLQSITAGDISLRKKELSTFDQKPIILSSVFGNTEAKMSPTSSASDSSKQQSWQAEGLEQADGKLLHSVDHSNMKLSNPHAIGSSKNKRFLPISPLMDPSFRQAREKYRCPKQKSPQSLTPMQLAVRKNIYARALSTPLRKCKLTGISLPSFFLLRFHAIADPKTGVPWYLPRGLSKHYQSSQKADKISETPTSNISTSCQIVEENGKVPIYVNKLTLDLRSKHDLHIGDKAIFSKDNLKPDHSKSQDLLSPLTPTIGIGTYFVSSYNALQSLAASNQKNSNSLVPAFISQSMRNHPLVLKTSRTTRFRPDMADFVLNLKRRRVFEELLQVTSKTRGYISKFIPSKSLKTRQVAAVLLLGSSALHTTSEIVTEQDFNSYVGENSGHIPIFDLRILLGQLMLQDLRDSDKTRWNCEVLTVKSRNYTLNLMMKLWELEGFLTPPSKTR